MLTANQQCVLCPQLVKDQCNTLLKKRSPKKCLFESDPKETRRLLEELLEEQFLADRELMLRKYNFDILTSTFVTNVRSAPEREKETGSEDMPNNFLIPAGFPLLQATTDDAAEQSRFVSESEVRHRPGKDSPYRRQTRITGKSPCFDLCNVSLD